MIDMHCHILPAIDDGAKDLDTALAMLEIAKQNGTTAICATPHVIEGRWLPEWTTITGLCRELSRAAANEGINLPLYPGGEVAIHWDLLDRLKGPGPYCLNSGRYMLVELPAAEIPSFTEDFLFTLQTRGITPILVHPERHPAIMADPSLLIEWVRRGLLLQINGPSLTGKMGEKVMKTAETLLLSNLVHIIGSDAHSARTRKPDLSEAKAKILAMTNTQTAKTLFEDNPKAIINSEDIQVPEVTTIHRPRKKGLLQRIFG